MRREGKHDGRQRRKDRNNRETAGRKCTGARVNKCPQSHWISLSLFGVVLGRNPGVCGKFVSQWKQLDARLTRERAQEVKSSECNANIASEHAYMRRIENIFNDILIPKYIDIDR